MIAEHHFALLAKSGITAQYAAMRGYETITDREGLQHDTLGDRESCRAWPWHRLECPERLRRRDRDRLGHLTSTCRTSEVYVGNK